ncbi:hypothetical protein CBL_04150 [Carabus blaptoides fortunei]
MAVSEENYLLSTEEDCSSLEEEDYSADSEFELGDILGDIHSSDEQDGSQSVVDFEQGTNSPQLRSSTNSNANNEFPMERVYGPLYTAFRSNRIANRDIVDEGLRLYLMFLQQEIIRNRIPAPEYLHRRNRIMPRNIANLRALADQFSQSPQRQWIRQQAQLVPLQSLNFHSFTDLLIGLFQEGGVTWERVIVLFFFCTDISIRALQEQLIRQFQRIQDWTTRFIQETVCTWVELEGGWTIIFQQSLNHATKIAILGFCCVGIVALCIYIRNNTK